jgi:potassium inwardly-rectifying channel subfamily J
MKKQPSMLSLRNRRDPKYQGNRQIRPYRVLNKSGDRNVNGINLTEKSVKFTKDLVNTLVETQWRYVLLFFTFAFFGSWTFFAIFYWIIAWSHGDLIFDEETGQRLGEDSGPCIVETETFIEFFLFSVETQVSTGFGRYQPTEICPEAIFVIIVQLICGLVIDAAVVGIFYVKIIRPPKYSQFKFSRKAVICQRDSRLCLVFRVVDFHQSHAIDTEIRAYLFEEKISFEGEQIGKSQENLKLENNGRVLLLTWPITVCHVIDKTSPFYDLSAKDLLERR